MEVSSSIFFMQLPLCHVAANLGQLIRDAFGLFVPLFAHLIWCAPEVDPHSFVLISHLSFPV